MLAICFVNGTSASITSASRLLLAMARDKGIFYSHSFAHISKSLDVPVHAIVLCAVFNLIFGLLYLGPYVAFSAYMASCTIFLNVSYAMPIIVLLIRGRGFLAQHRHEKVPHQLGRFWGYTLNIVASLYVVFATVVSGSFPFEYILVVRSANTFIITALQLPNCSTSDGTNHE